LLREESPLLFPPVKNGSTPGDTLLEGVTFQSGFFREKFFGK